MTWKELGALMCGGIGAALSIYFKYWLDRRIIAVKDSDAVKAARETAAASVKIKEIDDDTALRHEILTEWRQVRCELKECQQHAQECEIRHNSLQHNYTNLEARFQNLEERFKDAQNNLLGG